MSTIIRMPQKKGVSFGQLTAGRAFVDNGVLYIKTASNASKDISALRVWDGRHFHYGPLVSVQPVNLEILVKE